MTGNEPTQHPISLNPPQLMVRPGERMEAVRLTDWQRLRASVAGLTQTAPSLSNAAWTFLGVGISGAAAVPPWLAAYGDLTDAGQRQYVWVTSALIAVAVVGLLAALVCFIAARQVRGATQTTVTSVLEDMDAMVEPLADPRPPGA